MLLRPLKGKRLLIEHCCHWYLQPCKIKEPLQHLAAIAGQPRIWQRVEQILLDEKLRLLYQWRCALLACAQALQRACVCCLLYDQEDIPRCV